MTTVEIIEQFRHVPAKNVDFAPYERALKAAFELKEALVPELIAQIEAVTANPDAFLNDHQDCRACMALYLLAQFRETRALEPFLRFFELPGEMPLDLTGDMLTESGDTILASVCNGDPSPLLRLILNETLNEYIRTQAIDALLIQQAWGERSREAVVEDLRRLYQTMAKPGHSYVWAGLAGAICDLHAPELMAEARQAFKDDLVDESSCDEGWVEECLSDPAKKAVSRFLKRHTPIDAIAEIGSWCCFRNDAKVWRFDKDKEDLNYNPEQLLPSYHDSYVSPTPSQPFIAPPKPGRNEPCSCGSGKKYKKCCGK